MFILDAHFFASVRLNLFAGRLTTLQMSGIQAIVDAWNKGYPTGRGEHLSYCLATAYHETAHTMQPIEEYGRGVGKRYGAKDPQTGQIYYGRGYVQLTWRVNYEKMALLTGADLVHKPVLALDPTIAAQVMFEGMSRGTFTGRKLADYFNDKVEDPVGARRIINGTDCAEQIADYFDNFTDALDQLST